MAAITYPLDATEALQEVRSMLHETTASYWTDEELNNLVIRGSQYVAGKALCIIKQDTIAMVATTMAYTAMTAAGAGGVAKVLRIWGAAYDTSYKALMRIIPTNLYQLTNKTAGPPDYYFHMNASFYVYPVPTSTEATKLVTVWYSETADAITDLPDYAQEAALEFAVSRALRKLGKYSQAHDHMQRCDYLCLSIRNDMLDLPPDSLDKLIQPKRTVR